MGGRLADVSLFPGGVGAEARSVPGQSDSPSWLRFHPRMMPVAGAIFIALLVFGQIGAALGTYMMLEHNRQNAYCAYVGPADEGNYYGYGPCRIGLGELTLLFAQNVYVVGVLLLPFALLGWLVVRLIASPEYGRNR